MSWPKRGEVVLLVESDRDNRDMYAYYLHALGGFTVQTADTTDAAWRSARDADVVVTGIRVPGSWDGVELVRRLRNADVTMPIIVLTTCTAHADEQQAYAAGCDLFLPKACLPGRLVHEIRAVLAQRYVSMRRAHMSDRHRSAS